MFARCLRAAVAISGIMLATLLPFLPGRYDNLAVPLSFMCQIFGKVGLLLVPVGALWLASGYWGRLAGAQYGLAIAGLIATSIVAVIVSLSALLSSGVLFGLSLTLWIYVFWRSLRGLRRLKGAPSRQTGAIPVNMLIVPVAVTLLQMAVVGPAIEFSRNRAIRNSARLIADIEQYRTANGRYPESLLSVWEDYLPGVVGIEKYHYEPSGNSYNLFFEQFALNFGTREIVMYNPSDQQAMTSHKLDRLQLTPQELIPEQTRGHYAVHLAPYPHWKYYWFD